MPGNYNQPFYYFVNQMRIKRVGTNVNETKKVAGKPGLKFCLVQILVVVAIIHVGKLEGR